MQTSISKLFRVSATNDAKIPSFNQLTMQAYEINSYYKEMFLDYWLVWQKFLALAFVKYCI